MTPLAWCFILLAVGIACVFLEMFLPSAGVLSVIAAIFVVASVVLAYYFHGLAIGTGFLAIAVVTLPGSVALAIRWYPQTPFGRLLIPDPPTSEETRADELLSQQRAKLKGKTGRTTTTMLPGGTVKIDGQIYDAVSEAGVIEANEPVMVVKIDTNHLVVRSTQGQLTDTPDEPEKGASNPDDILSTPIESLGLDPLEDPLA